MRKFFNELLQKEFQIKFARKDCWGGVHSQEVFPRCRWVVQQSRCCDSFQTQMKPQESWQHLQWPTALENNYITACNGLVARAWLTFEDHVWCFVDHESVEVHGVHENLLSTEFYWSVPPRAHRNWEDNHKNETIHCQDLVKKNPKFIKKIL